MCIACVKMKLHEKLSPFLHIPILVKLVTVLVTATWIIFTIDIMIESNNVIVGVTTSGQRFKSDFCDVKDEHSPFNPIFKLL